MSTSSQESQLKPGGNTKTPGFYQQYRWFLTIKHNENITASQLSQHFKEFCKKFTFQLEKGESGYEHWQCEISLITKHNMNTVKNLIGIPEAHLEPTKDYFQAKNYCSKIESRIEGPYTEKSIFIDIPILEFEWQKELKQYLLTTKPDKRKVIWFVNPKGGMGKSDFAKHMVLKYKDKVAVFPNAKTSDIAYAITDKCEICIFDLPMSIEHNFNYSALEQVKNGMIFSSKYESNMKIFNRPHVIVLSNWGPDKSQLSQDRWDIRQL